MSINSQDSSLKRLEQYISQFAISFFCGLPSVYHYFETYQKRLKACSYQDLLAGAQSIPRVKWGPWKQETIYFISLDKKRLEQIDIEIGGHPIRQKVVEMVLDVLYQTILTS